ncbi:MAG: ABC transporter permease [Nocardioides sp.]|nr:ABC transporter permease [Nocardioides sp.]
MPADSWRTRLRDPGSWAEWAAPVGFVVMVLIFQALNTTFLSLGNVEAMLAASAILIVLAVGQTFAVSTGGIDLSVASNMTFSAIIFGTVFGSGAPVGFAFLGALVAGTAFGLLQGVLIGRGKITDFIVTLGGFSVASGLALVVSDGQPTTVIDRFVLEFATGSVWIIGYPVIVAFLVAAVAHVLLFHTKFGTHVLAAGGSEEAATATGISVARVKTAVHTISGVCAGIAGAMLVARIGAAEPAANTQFLLNCVAAVVLGGVALVGGRATIIGPLFGALLLTGLTNGLTLVGVSQYYQPVAVGCVVVAAAFLSRYQK